MSEDTIATLLRIAAGSTLAAIAVMLLSAPLRRLLGAESAYRLWFAVPLASIGAAWPKPATDLAAPLVEAIVIAGTAGPADALAAAVATGVALDVALAWLWLAGAVGAAVVLWLRQRRVVRDLQGPAPDGSWRHPGGLGPALVGAWRPRLVLPADFEARYAAAERQLILLHEDVHRARRDGAWNLLAAVMLCLNWFNPIAYLAHVRFRRDQELACDATVLRLMPGSARHYAHAMLKAADAVRWLPVACHWPPRHALVERIEALAVHGRAAPLRPLGTALVSLLVLGVAATAHAVQPAPVATPAATVAEPAAPVHYLIEGSLLRDGRVHGRPMIIVAAGQPGAIEVDGAPGYRLHFLAGRGGALDNVLEARLDADDRRLPRAERRFDFDRVLADAVLETATADGRSTLRFAFRAEALTEAESEALQQALRREQAAVANEARLTPAVLDTQRERPHEAASGADGEAGASGSSAPVRYESRPRNATSRASAPPRSRVATPASATGGSPVGGAVAPAMAPTAIAALDGGSPQSSVAGSRPGAERAGDTVAAPARAASRTAAPGRDGTAVPLPAAGLAAAPRVLQRTLASPTARAIRFSAEDIALQRPIEVPLLLAIDARGRLASVAVRGDAPPAAADAARRWVQQWRFAAARDPEGQRVAGTLQVTARFFPPPKFVARAGGRTPSRD